MKWALSLATMLVYSVEPSDIKLSRDMQRNGWTPVGDILEETAQNSSCACALAFFAFSFALLSSSRASVTYSHIHTGKVIDELS